MYQFSFHLLVTNRPTLAWQTNMFSRHISDIIVFSLKALICLVDKKSGEKSKTRPRFVKQDQVCIARLRAAGTICLETFKDFPQMGRFTLRDEGRKNTPGTSPFDLFCMCIKILLTN